MVKLSNLLLAAALAAIARVPALADRCLGIPAGEIVWCDDFDNYCTGGEAWPGYPPFPTACPTDGSAVPDNAAFLANWTLPTNCVWADNQAIVADPTRVDSAPFAMKFRGMGYAGDPQPTNLASSRHVFPLQSAILAKDPSKSGVNGTDQNPLKLKYVLHHNMNTDCSFCGGDVGNAIWYAELTLDEDRAPTDYVLKHCDYATESAAIYPMICQQNQAVPGCPPLSTTGHASIAVGLLALLDTYPCDVENGRRPTNYHLSVFDGLKWWVLKSNTFPGTGDFAVGLGGPAQVYLEVRTSSIFVTWDIVYEGVPQHSEATIPRQYLGAFDRVASGPGPGCELDPTTHACISGYDCFKYCDTKANWCWRNTWVDSMVLYDGVTVDVRGACCQPDASCSLMTAGECSAAGGVFRGLNTACDASACTGACCQPAGVCTQTLPSQCPGSFGGIGTDCATTGICQCPTPFANWDFDTDVDMDDFAALQRCLTLGGGAIPTVPAQCSCFDVTGGPTGGADGVINLEDVQRFIVCASGKGVVWTPTADCP